MEDLPLSHKYPAPYNTVQHKNVLVSTVLATQPINVTFRRRLNDNKWVQWLHLYERLISINLTAEPDKFLWRLTVYLRKYLWKLKIPLKIKIFM
jgi:hypothetical protein